MAVLITLWEKFKFYNRMTSIKILFLQVANTIIFLWSQLVVLTLQLILNIEILYVLYSQVKEVESRKFMSFKNIYPFGMRAN